NKDAARTAKSAREELGDVSADELPIKNFDQLAVADAVKAVKNLTTAHDIRVVITYEEAHKARANVVSAAQTQLASIAKEAVGVN
ncbi:MAG TPA: ferritin-like domain-containing protein, partial [Blastococcus sp.]